MRHSTTALGVVLVLAAGTASVAQAQRAGPPKTSEELEQPAPAKKGKATVTIGDRKVEISMSFAKAYQEAQAALAANDVAGAAAKLAAAKAGATSPEERYLIAQLQLKLADKTKNEAEIAAALEAMLATGLVPQAQVPVVTLTLAKARYNAKQYDQAAALFERVIQLQPNNAEATNLLAQTRIVQGRGEDSLALLQKSIAQQTASGGKAPADLYERAVAVAYNARSPMALTLSRDWVAAYPSPATWADALRIYRNLNTLDPAATLDALRLTRAVNALKDADYERYAYIALMRGYPAEAKAVLEQGAAAGAIDVTKTPYKELFDESKKKAAGEAGGLDSAAQKALQSGAARQLVTTGDLLYGYGQYAKAAELYRAALAKSGVDKDLANLHLGLALANAGDKAGATAALKAVTGPRAELAKYALIYVGSPA